MILGIVSNCWRVQLEAGEPLDRLIAEALRRGFRAIELRQGCLGRYERGAAQVPDSDALTELPRRFPEATFNMALAFPCFSRSATIDSALFLAGVEAAAALAGQGAAHLRLVDLTTTILVAAHDDEAHDNEDRAARLAALVEPLAAQRGVLSIENARQPWYATLDTLRTARRQLGAKAGHLRLCYDACNLLMAPNQPNCGDATRSLAADELASVHFKQQSDGRILLTVADGDVDWAEQLQTLKAIDYQGPALFEVAPDQAIWENLEQSRSYLDNLDKPGGGVHI